MTLALCKAYGYQVTTLCSCLIVSIVMNYYFSKYDNSKSKSCESLRMAYVFDGFNGTVRCRFQFLSIIYLHRQIQIHSDKIIVFGENMFFMSLHPSLTIISMFLPVSKCPLMILYVPTSYSISLLYALLPHNFIPCYFVTCLVKLFHVTLCLFIIPCWP